MARNPNWSREEEIVVLDYYFRVFHDGDDYATLTKEASELLRKMPNSKKAVNKETFRNENGIGLRMANFKSLDPAYAGSGMSNVGPSTIAIWEELSNDRSRLRNEADKIRRKYFNANAHLDDLSAIELETTVEPATEGEKVRQYSTRYERSAKNRKAAIELHGTKCQICGFDFEEMYGALGKGFIEVHHVKPLYLSEGECAINPAEDLVCVCSNCHRMIHRRRGSVVEIDELRRTVEENRR